MAPYPYENFDATVSKFPKNAIRCYGESERKGRLDRLLSELAAQIFPLWNDRSLDWESGGSGCGVEQGESFRQRVLRPGDASLLRKRGGRVVVVLEGRGGSGQVVELRLYGDACGFGQSFQCTVVDLIERRSLPIERLTFRAIASLVSSRIGEICIPL